MKNMNIIIGFELKNYFKNKTFVITTVLICLIGLIAMFIPRFFNVFDQKKDSEKIYSEADIEKGKAENVILLIDSSGVIDLALMADYFPKNEIEIASNEQEIITKVENQEVKAGFIITSLTEFSYFIYNKGFNDIYQRQFYNLMQEQAQINYFNEQGLDYEQYKNVKNQIITVNEQVLGKDTMSNFWYCYGLVIIVFMLIVLYGIMIATSITTEKSNRSIEVLVTSTSSTGLLFSKVFAGAIASLVQVGSVLICILGSYQINRTFWGGRLDMLFNIPAEVLIAFGFFGLAGYLLYAFLFGMMGALVSKTEDINKSCGSIQMIIMVVYFIVLFQLNNIDGIAIKIASFLPISSYSAMFARIAMGSVELWEIIVSYILLVISIIAAGVIGAKVYRNSTLRYGNPIKLTSVLKSLKKDE